MKIFALDDRPYDKCGIEVVQAAIARGHEAKLFHRARQVTGQSGYVFARLAQWEPRITADRLEIDCISKTNFKFIQDRTQIECYESKLEQAARFQEWLPETWVFTDQVEAMQFVSGARFPLVSKSSVGSASHNVRLLRNADDAIRELEQVFGAGIPVKAGAGNATRQKGYVLWQAFIPHDVTFRVTRVGDKFHCYERFNYDDRPMAAPSRVKQTHPVSQDGFEKSLGEFSRRLTDAIGTKWVALDILWDTQFQEWRLLETALAWARGNDPAGNAPFYGTSYSLNTQHELLVEQIEQGVFG